MRSLAASCTMTRLRFLRRRRSSLVYAALACVLVLPQVPARRQRPIQQRPLVNHGISRWTPALPAHAVRFNPMRMSDRMSGKAGESKLPLKPMDGEVDPKACMGTWYVHHQIPALAFLEAGGRNGIEKYTWDEDNNRFSVEYSFNRKGSPADAITTVRQRGWVANDEGTQWRVAPMIGGFVPPVRLPFIMIDVEPASHMLCTGGLGSWLYVMTRERKPDRALLQELLRRVESVGFDMAKVLPVEHDL